MPSAPCLSRGQCEESACRGRSVEDNLRIWEEMKGGTEVGLANAMRFKMDMKVRRRGLGFGVWVLGLV